MTRENLSASPKWSVWLSNSGLSFVLDVEGTILAASSCELLGVPLDARALVGKPLLPLLTEHAGLALPDGLADATRSALERLRSGARAQTTPVFGHEAVVSAAASGEGSRRFLRALLVPHYGRERELTWISFTLEDVTHLAGLVGDGAGHVGDDLRAMRDELEAKVQQRTSELEHTNGELLRVIGEQLKTERALQRSQEQLQHAQRLEAVGRLAGGIAHDFNNLLSVVLGYSISLADELAEGSTMRADLEEIRRAGERAAELTQQLLAFGRQQVLEPRVLDLNEVVQRVERMIRRILGEDIELVTLASQPLWRIKVDPGQLEQVILNLVINARDAMPGGGRLTIETANAEFDEEYAQLHLGAAAGSHVVLAVTDTGIGMDKEIQSHVFEPFFTTKEKGKGTGLGLSTVFGIVKQSGGHIWLYSEPGRGTTFKVCFPRSAESVSGPPPQLPRRQSIPTGHETVLLVEDDAQLRALARTVLARHGYRVLDAPHPEAALELSQAHAAQIALLVTDVVMPQMSGRDLAERVLAHRPKIKVLYMSGYTDHAIVHNGILDPGVSFIQKPITPEAFARKVRQVLDGTG
ncbi:MAG TPA: ATP-binding protein [Polyangiales bacterium]|nr:ATP-binding protein [Polyangiales bacterium]